jgi:hypothetical protein
MTGESPTPLMQKLQQKIEDLRREIDEVEDFGRRVKLENSLNRLVDLLEAYTEKENLT